jgi:hypothetical protein
MYCKPGQPCSDGTYLSELEDNGYMFDVTHGARYWKWFGLFFGVGAGWQWPAARIPTAH